MFPMSDAMEIACDDCNGEYLINQKQADPAEYDGTHCPSCGEFNTWNRLDLRQKNREAGRDESDEEKAERAADEADHRALKRAEERRERYFDRHGHF